MSRGMRRERRELEDDATTFQSEKIRRVRGEGIEEGLFGNDGKSIFKKENEGSNF